MCCERSSSGRAPPCQGGGSEFEPRRSLQFSSKAAAEISAAAFLGHSNGYVPLFTNAAVHVIMFLFANLKEEGNQWTYEMMSEM
jgi:hypothetical protein